MGVSESVSRRSFMGAAGAAVAGTYLASSTPRVTAAEAKTPGVEKPEKNSGPVIDCHGHLTHHSSASYKERDRKLIEAADKLGIDQLCCSLLTPKRPATAEGFRECNVWMAEGMKRFSGRVLGYCYVNPGCGREALDEIRRCIEDRGFMGIKLYNEHKCTEPVVFPLVELAIELRAHPTPRRTRASPDSQPAKHLRRRRPSRVGTALS